MTLGERVRELVKVTPPGSLIPVDVIRQWVEEEGETEDETPRRDLTVEEVADIERRSPVTVRAWIREGLLEAYKYRNREYRITRANLEAFRSAERNGASNSEESRGAQEAIVGQD